METLKKINIEYGMNLSDTEQVFRDHIREKIQKIPGGLSPDEIEAEENALRKIFEEFHEFSATVAKSESTLNKNHKEPPEAAVLRMRAVEVIAAFQAEIIRAALTQMHINRCMADIRDRASKRIPGGFVREKNIRWSPDSAAMVNRHMKTCTYALETDERLHKGLPLLEKIGPLFESLENDIPAIYGKDQGKRIFSSFRAALRTGDFKRARATIKRMAESKAKFSLGTLTGNSDGRKKIADKASAFLETVETNAENLRDLEGRIYLRDKEIQALFDSHQKDIAKARNYIARYQIPYMEYKLEQLSRLKESLLILGTLETLMTIRSKLLRGLHTPMDDMKALRTYENILENVDYMLKGTFQDLDRFYRQSQDILDEYLTSSEAFQNILAGAFDSDIIIE